MFNLSQNKKEKKSKLSFLSDKTQNKLSLRKVPTLNDTKKSFIKFIKPFLNNKSDTEYHEELINEFVKGEGKILQKKLLDFSKLINSWYYDITMEHYHLKNRYPVPFNSNYFLVYDICFKDQIDAFAKIILCSILLKRIFKDNKISQITIKDHIQYFYLFHSCRIPNLNNKDKLNIYDYNENKFVVVIYKNVFWLVETSLDYDYLSDQLLYITSLDLSEKKENFIGVLTGLDRNRWGELRHIFHKISEKNRELLYYIERSMMVFCLCDNIYDRLSPEELLQTLWFNSFENRFFDKILQVIIFKDGSVCLNIEKSVDISVGIEFLKFIKNLNDNNEITKNYRKSNFLDPAVLNPNYYPTNKSNNLLKLKEEVLSNRNYFENFSYKPIKLNYELDDSLRGEIKNTNQKIEKTQFKNVNFEIFFFKDYGKNALDRKGFEITTYIQLAILSTYYRIYGKIVASRQFICGRNFRFGKVDYVRTTIKESVNFMVSLNELRIPRELKIKLGQDFFKANKNNISDILLGKSMDVHFYGLNSLVKENEKKISILNDEIFKKSSDFVIETYPILNENVKLCCQGYTHEIDGISIVYIARKDHFQFNIISANDLKRFTQTLEEILFELKDLFLEKGRDYPKF